MDYARSLWVLTEFCSIFWVNLDTASDDYPFVADIVVALILAEDLVTFGFWKVLPAAANCLCTLLEAPGLMAVLAATLMPAA